MFATFTSTFTKIIPDSQHFRSFPRVEMEAPLQLTGPELLALRFVSSTVGKATTGG
jgi:hypothetical protein